MEGSIIVTGATGGMGSVAVRSLAAQGRPVIMACRNLQKAAVLRKDILQDFPDAEIRLRMLDLSSLDSVREFARAMEGLPVTALFNNAGVICRNYSQTDDGLERSFAVNFFGPYLLMRLLQPQLPAGSHIVNMVSLTWRFVRVTPDDLFPEAREFSQLGSYSRAKRALLLATMNVAQEAPGVVFQVADPGIVNTGMLSMGRWFDPLADVLFRPFTNSPAKGVSPALAALQSEGELRYYVGKTSKLMPRRIRSQAGVAAAVRAEADRFLGLAPAL